MRIPLGRRSNATTAQATTVHDEKRPAVRRPTLLGGRGGHKRPYRPTLVAKTLVPLLHIQEREELARCVARRRGDHRAVTRSRWVVRRTTSCPSFSLGGSGACGGGATGLRRRTDAGGRMNFVSQRRCDRHSFGGLRRYVWLLLPTRQWQRSNSPPALPWKSKSPSKIHPE